MKIIIVGVGKVGRLLVDYLTKENHEVIIIDTNEDIINELVDTFDVIGVVGNGASFDCLNDAKANNADLLIAVTELDELNILSCLVGRKYGIKHTIARVRNPEYSNQAFFLNQELGLNLVVNPELEAANEISRMLRFPSADNIETFANGRAEIICLHIKDNSPLCNLNLIEIKHKYKFNFLICAIEREGKALIPEGKSIIKENDIIHLTGPKKEITLFFKEIGIFKNKTKNVMLIGGGKLSFYLAKQLLDNNLRVKIFEIDPNRCKELKEALPNATIVIGDGSNQDLLYEEGITNTDALVALTGFDEENIILGLYAKRLNIPKIITKVNKFSYLDILQSLGLTSSISPKFVTANHILSYARSIQNTLDSKVETVYKLANGLVEFLEFLITNESEVTNIKLKDLKLNDNILIACIIRKNNLIIPNGNSYIMPHDRVILATTNSNINDIMDILKR